MWRLGNTARGRAQIPQAQVHWPQLVAEIIAAVSLSNGMATMDNAILGLRTSFYSMPSRWHFEKQVQMSLQQLYSYF